VRHPAPIALRRRGTHLAPIARLSRPLGVGQLPLDTRAEVIPLRRTLRLLLDALHLDSQLRVRFVVKRALRGHDCARAADGIFRASVNKPLGCGGGMVA
jgi:hypothetical protein